MFILYYLLGILVSFLFFSIVCRIDNNAIETWDNNMWTGILLSSIFFPVGLVMFFSLFFKDELVKERSFKKLLK